MRISASVQVIPRNNGKINTICSYMSFIQIFFHTCNIYSTLYMNVIRFVIT